AIHPDDKYNKNVVSGSNGIKLPEKYVNKKEAQKSFKWQWEKNDKTLLNSHNVTLEIKILKKEVSKVK
ncbi:MAG: hypothetical protein GY757_24145, partial [bacterium]|nr:hypothetical protein [bacterium]